jgi:hypothetical protein
MRRASVRFKKKMLRGGLSSVARRWLNISRHDNQTRTDRAGRPGNAGPLAPDRRAVTPFELSLQNDLNIEWQRFANDWLFKWYGMTYEGGVTDVDDFRGGRIHFGGIKYGGQQQQIFWQALDRYLISKVHEIFKRWDTETAEYSVTTRLLSIDGVERHLRQFVHRIIEHARDTDQRLRGRGYPRDVVPYDATKHMNSAQAEIGRIAQAHKKLLQAALEKERKYKEPIQLWKQLENFYANNKGLIWLGGLIVAAILWTLHHFSGDIISAISD